jgi:hypothetical protein
MVPVAIFALVAIGIFTALLVLMVESWVTRIVLAAIVLVVWLWLGMIGVMITTALLSIGILIGKQIPTVSKL